MNYPLSLVFKVVAIHPQISVTDAEGTLMFYVKQKAFKLKEAVTVYADREQTLPVYTMKADRVLDFRANYQFTDAEGRDIGSVRGEGMRSIWTSRYTILDAEGAPDLEISEDNPWVKVIDSVVGEIPVISAATGYLFHPSYSVTQPDGTAALRLRKEPAFFESRFTLEKLGPLGKEEEERALLSLLMMLLLERSRG